MNKLRRVNVQTHECVHVWTHSATGIPRFRSIDDWQLIRYFLNVWRIIISNIAFNIALNKWAHGCIEPCVFVQSLFVAHTLPLPLSLSISLFSLETLKMSNQPPNRVNRISTKSKTKLKHNFYERNIFSIFPSVLPSHTRTHTHYTHADRSNWRRDRNTLYRRYRTECVLFFILCAEELLFCLSIQLMYASRESTFLFFSCAALPLDALA